MDEIVVYCACTEWCPPLLAGWLQYIIPGVWMSVWCTAHALNGVPTIGWLVTAGHSPAGKKTKGQAAVNSSMHIIMIV